MTHPGGRPRKYDNPEELRAKVEEYFREGVRKRPVVIGRGHDAKVIEVPAPTITGLVLYCGFVNRNSFYDMEARPEFTSTIKWARSLIERSYEEALLSGGNPAGPIFALKNLGWSDRLELTGRDGGPIKQEQAVKFDWGKVSDDDMEGIVKTAEKFLSTL